MMVSVNMKNEHVSLSLESVYDWEVVYTKNPRYGIDSIVNLHLSTNKMFSIIAFLSEHLNNEIVQVNLKTPDGGLEVEAVVTRGSLTYLNGMSDTYNREEVPQY